MNTHTEQWNEAITDEMQELINSAANIRRSITEAKTDAKRVYYGKKFKKVQTDIMRMLIAREHFAASAREASNVSNVA